MLTLEKKCPACGSRDLTRRTRSGHLAALPFAQCYACTACRQQIVYLYGLSVAVENRHSTRTQLPPNFIVRIHGGNDRFARIKNISEGGICFDRHIGADAISRFLLLDIFNCSDGTSLDGLPAEIVATSSQALTIRGIQTTVYNNCARFVHLNKAQQKVLNFCIGRYGISGEY